jgi:chromosome segregation ATPase
MITNWIRALVRGENIHGHASGAGSLPDDRVDTLQLAESQQKIESIGAEIEHSRAENDSNREPIQAKVQELKDVQARYALENQTVSRLISKLEDCNKQVRVNETQKTALTEPLENIETDSKSSIELIEAELSNLRDSHMSQVSNSSALIESQKQELDSNDISLRESTHRISELTSELSNLHKAAENGHSMREVLEELTRDNDQKNS